MDSFGAGTEQMPGHGDDGPARAARRVALAPDQTLGQFDGVRQGIDETINMQV
jgi:hypothetical protein